jgi:hypothetical protein
MNSDDLLRQMQGLLDKQAITEVLFRYCRGIDRHDRALLASVYHDDAEDYHGIYNGPISGFFERMKGPPAGLLATHHSVSNILVELDGDVARVESYLNAMHRRQSAEGLVDDLLKCRYVDRFERRNGEWKIAKRSVIYDWGVTQPAVEKGWWDDAPGEYLFGRKDRSDPVYLSAFYERSL